MQFTLLLEARRQGELNGHCVRPSFKNRPQLLGSDELEGFHLLAEVDEGVRGGVDAEPELLGRLDRELLEVRVDELVVEEEQGGASDGALQVHLGPGGAAGVNSGAGEVS